MAAWLPNDTMFLASALEHYPEPDLSGACDWLRVCGPLAIDLYGESYHLVEKLPVRQALCASLALRRRVDSGEGRVKVLRPKIILAA
jgi:hypothetical protein